jgi:hypothetical protein
LVGAFGVRYSSKGTTGPDERDVPDRPPAFSAVAVNVYEVPLVSPDTVHVLLRAVDTDTVHVRPLGEAVKVMVVAFCPLKLGNDAHKVT